jgi:hypothetical protein
VVSKATFAVVAAAGLLGTGLSGCSSDAPQLSCSAQPSSLSPVAGTTQTIAIKTAAGAKILTDAALQTNPFRTATADSAGIARVSYPVTAASAGRPVKVTIAVVKQGGNGSCSVTFTPKRAPALSAAISAQWQVPVPLPAGSGACTSAHPGQGPCGSVVIKALISGFHNFGGTPTCPTSGANDCADSGGAQLSGQFAVSWAISCPATGLTSNNNDVPVTLSPEFGSHNSKVTPVTRVNADQARVELTADLPFAPEVANCTQAPVLQSLSVSNVTLKLQGGTYPTSNFSAAGPLTH